MCIVQTLQGMPTITTFAHLFVSFSVSTLLFSCLVFVSLNSGPSEAWEPGFIEPPKPPFATPLQDGINFTIVVVVMLLLCNYCRSCHHNHY